MDPVVLLSAPEAKLPESVRGCNTYNYVFNRLK